MMSNMKALGIDQLCMDDRLSLMHEIWDSIAIESGHTHLSDAQRGDLKRRVAEHEKAPQDVVPWAQIKSDALTRFQK